MTYSLENRDQDVFTDYQSKKINFYKKLKQNNK